MLATFYLTGPFSASTLSTEFTITGEPGGIVHPGVTKAQLLTGHTIVFVDSVTGGTVTATNETCEGTQKSWAVIQSTPTPTPTPTITSTPLPPLYGFFRSNPSVEALGHCEQNQITSALFYSTSTTISGMLGTTVYDGNQDPWVGGDFYYAVSSDDTFNTNDQPYSVIEVDNYGMVTDVQYITDCGGGGGAIV
jgi:hypothetical protein